jgi:hypothetical protein
VTETNGSGACFQGVVRVMSDTHRLLVRLSVQELWEPVVPTAVDLEREMLCRNIMSP